MRCHNVSDSLIHPHKNIANDVQHLLVNSASECAALAKRFAATMPPPPLLVYLQGTLGAGKTFWAREVIAELGGGQATSPTFAWALSYPAARVLVHHLDLFRLPNNTPPPEELLELLDESSLCLIEWAERANLPPADVHLVFSFVDDVQDIKDVQGIQSVQESQDVQDIQKLKDIQKPQNQNSDEKRTIALTSNSHKGQKWIRDFCR